MVTPLHNGHFATVSLMFSLQPFDGRGSHEGRIASGQEATREFATGFRFHQLLTGALQKQLKLSGGDMPRDDKVAILKDSLAAIGRRIDTVLAQKQNAGEDADRWRKHLWTWVPSHTVYLYHQIHFHHRFVTLFWPKKVKAAKLEEIHAKMVMKEGTPRTSAMVAAPKVPRPSTGGKTNGSLPTPSSSHRNNGKPHR